jgi:hypothetical protein
MGQRNSFTGSEGRPIFWHQAQGERPLILLGRYRAVACNFFPCTVLQDKGVGAKDGLDAVFAADHCIVGVRVGGNRGAAIEANFEVADLLAIPLIVGGVFHIG